MSRGIASCILKANPVLNWETYVHTFARREMIAPELKFRDVGGYWTASFSLAPHLIDRTFVNDLLINGAMREAQFFDHRGQGMWEGVLWGVNLNTPYGEVELNLANHNNKMWARYDTGSAVDRSTVIESMVSQAKIGIHERIITAGLVPVSVADQGIQQLIDWTGVAGPSIRELKAGNTHARTGGFSCELKFAGYWHLFNKRTYNQTALTGNANLTTIVTDVVSETGQFVNSSYIENNSTVVDREFDTDRKPNEIMISLAALGDAAYQRWIVGMGWEREFYYKQAARADRGI